MFRGKWKRMQLVNAAGGEGAGDSVDFGEFFGSGGATKNEQDEATTEDISEEQIDEPTDDEEGDSIDDTATEDDEDADDTSDDADTTAVSLAAIKQHQEIIADLLKKSKESDIQSQEETTVADIDPFESEEFSNLRDVMNWDEDEAKAAKTFFQKFMDFGNKKAFERFNQETPQMIETTIQRNERIKATRRDFYESNPLLSEVKPFVGQIAQGVAQEMGQSATMEAVLAESARRAYKALGVDPTKVAELATQQHKKGKTKPAFPVKKGVRKQTTKPPKIQQEIDAVIGI